MHPFQLFLWLQLYTTMNLRVVHYQTGLCQFSVQFKHNTAKIVLSIHHPPKRALPRLCLHGKRHLHSCSHSGLNLAPCLDLASHPKPIHQAHTTKPIHCFDLVFKGYQFVHISLCPQFISHLYYHSGLLTGLPVSIVIWSVPTELPESLSPMLVRSHYSPALTPTKFPITLRIKFQPVAMSSNTNIYLYI